MREDAPMPAGESRWFESGWYRMSIASSPPDAASLVLRRDEPGARVQRYPMLATGDGAEGIVAIAQGHWTVAAAAPGVDVRCEALDRGAALRAMWRVVAGAGAASRLAAAWRLLRALPRGPRGVAEALVAAYQRELLLRAGSRAGAQVVRYRRAPWPARAEPALLAPGRADAPAAPGAVDAADLGLARVPDWLPIEAGWYLLDLDCRAADGQVHSLLLQPDRGHGPAPDRVWCCRTRPAAAASGCCWCSTRRRAGCGCARRGATRSCRCRRSRWSGSGGCARCGNCYAAVPHAPAGRGGRTPRASRARYGHRA